MGIFSPNQPKAKDAASKIRDLKRKIDQLRAAGFNGSAERLELQVKRYEHVSVEKVKPLSPGELKKQIQGAKATGQAK